MKRETKIFGLLSILILFLGILLQSSPHLQDLLRIQLLRIPDVGYVLYARAGGECPAFFRREPWRAGREDVWSKTGDVVVAVPVKMGTTWMLNTIHHIRTKGTDADFSDLLLRTPWVDLWEYPGQPLEELAERWETLSRGMPFRVFKTHMQPPIIAPRNTTKYVVAFRNLYDAIASLRPFFANIDPNYAQVWGGYPPPKPQTMEDYEHHVLRDVGFGRSLLDIFYIDFIRGWWPYRNDPNVLFVHYSERFYHPSEDLDRLVSFLGMEPLAPEIKARVLELSSFQWMKANDLKFDLQHVLDQARADGHFPKWFDRGGVMRPNTLVYKGGVDRPKSEGLRPEFLREVGEEARKRLGDQVWEYIQNGNVSREQLRDIELAPLPGY